MIAPLPSVEEYLGKLPHGIASHPEAVVKGSVLLALRNHPAFDVLARHAELPAPARQLITTLPTATSWIPEVHFNTTMAGFYDLVFRDNGGLAAYEAWVARKNLTLLQAPLYRVLFLVASPQRLLASVSGRWGAFRRGTTLTLMHGDRTSVDLELAFPSHLEPATALHAFSGAFRAVARAARVSVTSIIVTAELGSSARWHLEWR